MNILTALQRRQFCQEEHWNHKLLYNYCEQTTLRRLDDKSSWQEVVSGRQSTMIIAFSCNGEYMASGHLTHEIIVHRMVPKIHYIQTLSGHARTPWCLTFDPVSPHILYSGCLAGTIQKWNIHTGKPFDVKFDLGRHSPINNIAFLPSDPSLILVALECWLYMLSASDFQVIWSARTDTLSAKVSVKFNRLVLHHPEESRILTAIMNPPPGGNPYQPSYIRTAIATRTTSRLQIFGLHRTSPPDLEDSSSGLVCLSARIFGPHSCVLTTDHVICSRITDSGQTMISMYSIGPRNFGACLCSIPLASVHPCTNVVSLDVSPCGTHLLLGLSSRKDLFHMNRTASRTTLAVIHEICTKDTEDKITLKEICTVRSNRGDSSNIALWIPPASGHGVCLCVGTQKGSVLCSHLNNEGQKHRCRQNLVFLCEFVIPTIPDIPIPPMQLRPL